MEGKGCIKAIKTPLIRKNINVGNIAYASIELLPAFIAGINAQFPQAEIHFARFHAVKLLGEAMAKVRQLECVEHVELKGHK